MIRSIGTFAIALSLAVPAAGQQTASSTKASNRPKLEQQLRERTAKVLQQRLGLSDVQMNQLEQSNRKFAPQLQQLAAQERDTRRQMRAEMQSASPNQQRVSDLLDASIQLQRQRLNVVEAEQKELAGFMTPVQRAGYLGFQVQLRRRAEQLSNQNGARKGPGFRKRPPGPGRLP